VRVAVGVLTELGVAGPVPLVFNAPALADQAQQGVWVVRMLVMNRCLTELVPLRVVVVVTTCTIQALPGQFSLMCSGASLADSSQSVSRPWRFS
jgi:hypothetical protein